MDKSALFKLGYGLYVLIGREGEKDTGCIVNTVMQAGDNPTTLSVAVNKLNYTHDVIKKTGEFNVSTLTTSTDFEIFKNFGFQSGKDINKFAKYNQLKRSKNGLLYLTENVNGYLSGKVVETIDFGSHTMFKAELTDCKVFSDEESLTYAYYHKNIKPKPEENKEDKKGWRCKICGYIHEDENLPDDFVCPWCKHGASDFEKI